LAAETWTASAASQQRASEAMMEHGGEKTTSKFESGNRKNKFSVKFENEFLRPKHFKRGGWSIFKGKSADTY